MLVAKTTGWSRAELLALPQAEFASYLAIALQAAGVDPTERHHMEGAPPPPDDTPLPESLTELLAAHGVRPKA